MGVPIDSTPESVRATYDRMRARLATVRKRRGRPLTLAEKILYGHLSDPDDAVLERGRALEGSRSCV